MREILFQISSHWDREWYLPFQGFRYELVKMLDGVLEALENGTIPSFVLDGQTVVLEDYLEIRPENRDRLERQIRDGKLRVGPWYVMPDEFSISGESLVENFLVGKAVSEAFGTQPWRFGYVNDVFGHIAQFPQILNGFGIDGAYLGRGVPGEYPNDTHFLWIAPDGSECYTYKDNYAEFRRKFCETKNSEKVLLEKLDGSTADYPILLNDTDDHAKIDADTIHLLQLLEKNDCHVLGGFECLADTMKPFRNRLPQVKGELASCAYQTNDFRVVTNSISSYYPIKQRNDQVEARLYRETAPILVMAEMKGRMTAIKPFFCLARRYLLKNQPHDSICGCSVDAVHRNMAYRYAQAEEIADSIRYDFTEQLKSDGQKDELTVTVLNTDLHSHQGIVTLTVDFPLDWSAVFSDNTGYQKINLFSVVDRNGNAVPCQILSIRNGYELYHRQYTTCVNRYTVAIRSELLPFGITEYRILPAERRSDLPPKTPKGNPIAQNEFLRLEITPDGTLNVTELQTGRAYQKLLWFVDDADSGNGWFHGEAGIDAPYVTSFGCPTEIESLLAGPLVWSFRIKKQMRIPAALNPENGGRSEQKMDMQIVSTVTLRKGERFISVETEISNSASAHRLRLMLPTDMPGETYFSSQAFCFVERNRGASVHGFNGREREYVEKNTEGIMGIDDAVAFVGEYGFHEGGVYPDGTISVTMFRSVEKNFHEPMSKEAKLIGTMTFRYAIAFGMEREELYHLRRMLQTGFPTLYTDSSSIACGDLLRLQNRKIIASTVKPAESGNGWIVRLFNPLDEMVSSELVADPDILLEECTLSEKADPEKSGIGKLKLHFLPYQIKTVLLQKTVRDERWNGS